MANRELKFRLWDEQRGRMVTKGLSFDYDEQWGPHNAYDEQAREIDSPNLVLMQYTGLKNKDGVEIYEGDWLKDDQGVLYQVKFGKLPLDKSGDCVCSFPAFYAEGRDSSASHECQEIGGWMVVIGNIHDNPELLTGGKGGE